jgi:hypothetical protein
MVLRKRLLPLLLAGILLVVAGCASEPALTMAPASMLPDYARDAPRTVREAYQFAAANPDILAHQPCYCGCGAMGHDSNLACFVQETLADGTVIFDSHAAGCGICVDIAQDVMRLTKQGLSQTEIRQYVDATYSPFGPSTDTPLPPL